MTRRTKNGTSRVCHDPTIIAADSLGATAVIAKRVRGGRRMDDIATAKRPEQSAHANMIFIPGGTFRMGSDKHYAEEAPAHRVTVDGFWIDSTPVTNRQFKEFVKATGHVTFAEIPPDPKDYPGALPHMLYAGSLVFSPQTRHVDLRDWSQWWTFLKGADWRHPYGPDSNLNGLDDHPVVHASFVDALAYAQWAGRTCQPRPNGSLPRAAVSMARSMPGAMNSRLAASI